MRIKCELRYRKKARQKKTELFRYMQRLMNESLELQAPKGK